MRISSTLLLPIWVLFWMTITPSCRHSATENVPPVSTYQATATHLTQLIQHEMADKKIPALSIALVDGQEIVWAQGFGHTDAAKKISASAQTIYRVGSVSKLFTDIGIMQLVEKGEIDLDQSVSDYVPDFQPNNPWQTSITLRQLMSHRSGLVREPPVGHYFDDTSPTLAATVASLNQTSLVYPPETRIKYSNAGIAVVGYALEHLHQTPFPQYLQNNVLKPLGLIHSSFEPTPTIQTRLAHADMWTYDGRIFPAPTFELGMAPAGSMYSSVLDLGQFMKVLFNGGKGPGGQVLRPETLEAMWTPQFAPEGTKTGYGIGFALSELDGHREIGHGGAIYGFSTQLQMLPEQKLGVIVTSALDGTNNVARRIAKRALRLMLGVKQNQPQPDPVFSQAMNPDVARKLDGIYQAENGDRIQLIERDGRLLIYRGSFRSEIKSLGDTLTTDSRLSYGTQVIPIDDDILRINGKVYVKLIDQKPPAPQSEWKGLIGEYGWDFNTLYILEKNEQLYALIEWFYMYPLTPVSKDTFAFPDYGLYHGEEIIFTRNEKGIATNAEAAGIAFERRPVGLEDGETFKITPIRPIEEIRADAIKADPPPQKEGLLAPDLVDLESLDASLKLDIRYATTNNFMGAIFYELPKAFMQRPAAEALVKVHQKLKQSGYGLLLHDAYRPWYVTKMFFDATPEDKKIFVATPSIGSIHNRGSAIDLTLYDLATGEPITMVSGYDEFSERAFPDYPGGTSQQRWHQEFLRDAMEEQGFTVYQWEWWHFNYKDAAKYPILNVRFEDFP